MGKSSSQLLCRFQFPLQKCEFFLTPCLFISSLSHSFQHIKSLHILSLASNHISKIDPDTFQSLSSLTHLYLDHNKLSDLHPNIFQNLWSLVHLDLSHNELSTLPLKLFHHLSNLSILDLHHNKLDNLSPSSFIGSLATIQHLDISHNYNIATNIPYDFFSSFESL